MMKFIRFSILFLISICLFACAIKKGSIQNPDKYFKKMSWMQTSWHNKSASTEQIEEWHQRIQDTIPTEQHIVVGRDTIYDEFGKIYYDKDDKNIYYASVVGKYIQEAEESYYLYKCNKHKVIFEIFKNDIRHTITYQKRGSDKVKITMTTYVGVEPHVESYTMKRIN